MRTRSAIGRALIAVIAIAVVMGGVAVYVATTSVSGNYTSKLQCSQTVLVVYASPVASGSSTTYTTVTTTVVENFTTTVNDSATVGQTTTAATNTDQGSPVRVGSGSTLVSISEARSASCTYIK
jgi:ribosomal protein L13